MKKDKIKKKFEMKMSRRQVLKAGLYGGAGLMLPWRFLPAKAFANSYAGACTIDDLECTNLDLNDPYNVLKFTVPVADALDPSFKYAPVGAMGGTPLYRVGVGYNTHYWGLREAPGGGTNRLSTPIYGYGQDGFYTWPGKTFEVQSNRAVQVQWENNIDPSGSLLPFESYPVDTSLHWCFSLPRYHRYSIAENGVPIVTHVHGHHSQYRSDGNPEEFFTYRWRVTGPRFRGRTSIYNNDQPAGNLWYHDHALGITRLNVYAGMAGFYFVRDEFDTGLQGNDLGLPAWPYEKAYAIQDRMFLSTGELFYPAFPGDPYYEGFINGEGANLPSGLFPNGGPTALAEFFGDHMVVNGRAWPKENVEPRNYRLRLLNGCDSRFLAVQFFEVDLGDTDFTSATGPLTFTVIGSDQSLASSPTNLETLLMETGSRYDIVFNFGGYQNKRIIMKNIGGDEPFGGDIPGQPVFPFTDRIMAFDVVTPKDISIPDPSPTGIEFGPSIGLPTRIRKVALFEGKDNFGRLQPLLGTAEPATDFVGRPINWPDTPEYADADLIGQMEGSIAWHSPTTENPALNSTEEWEIWNTTGDAHPVHLHLVNFEILDRQEIKWDTNIDEDGFIPAGASPANDGIYLVPQKVVQHDGEEGNGFRIVHPSNPNNAYGDPVQQPGEYVENARKDMVTALPGQITRIKAIFDKPGRFVWHCHILSHEDHEMMRTLYVGPETGPPA